MGWATQLIESLNKGLTVQCKPRGGSMKPIINPGQLCTIEPADPAKIKIGDVVLCRVRGQEYLHLVKALRKGPQFQIGNNRGHINGWIGQHSLFGRLIRIEGKGQRYVRSHVKWDATPLGEARVRCICGEIYFIKQDPGDYPCPKKCGHTIRIVESGDA